MPVIPNNPPMASRIELASLAPAGSPEPLSAAATPALAATPSELMAHRGFVMTATSAANGANPADEARYVGWRYVMLSVDGPGVATIVNDRDRNVHSFAAYDRGPYAVVAPAALRALIAYADGVARDFELRFLGLPALFVEAVWLKDVGGNNDLFLPFGLVPSGLSAETIYPVDGWRESVRALAAKTLAIAAEFERGL